MTAASGLNTASAVDNRNIFFFNEEEEANRLSLNTASAVDNRNISAESYDSVKARLSQYRLSGRQQKSVAVLVSMICISSQYRLSGRQQKSTSATRFLTSCASQYRLSGRQQKYMRRHKLRPLLLVCLNTASAVDNRNIMASVMKQLYWETSQYRLSGRQQK